VTEGVERRRLATRFRERLRYGLFTQEILDQLSRIGLLIRPYYLVEEGLREGQPVPAGADAYPVRFLTKDDLPEIIAISTRRPTAQFEKLISAGRCLGIFVDGELAGYTCSREDGVFLVWADPLLELNEREAYLFGAFVARSFRGHDLAPIVRYRLYEALAELGRHTLYSITLAFNRSSRRFKAKLGARELELRVILGFGRMVALDLRLWRFEGEARMKRGQFLSARTREAAIASS
jgi:hypothetical protein